MISQGIDNFLTYIREIEQLYRISVANEQEANDMTQDILHSIELEPHDYRGYAQLAKKIKGNQANAESVKRLSDANSSCIRVGGRK